MIDKFEGKYRFLSNFYPCEIYHKGITYPSVEHFYVASKVNDDQLINGIYYTKADFKEMISKIDSPAIAKKIGQKVKIRSDWNDIRLDIMKWAVTEKFKNEELSDLLLSTDDKELIEGNYWNDTFWGICNGKGKNNLGKILMKVRWEIRSKDKSLDNFF
jgi:N-glycosidase YbiA